MSEFERFFQNNFDDLIVTNHVNADYPEARAALKVAIKEFALKAFNAGERVGYLEGHLSGYQEGFATADSN